MTSTKSVTLVRNTLLTFPELWLEVYIHDVSRSEQAAFAEMLVPGRCTKAELPEDADLVIFTGGADVNPALYGQERHPMTHFDQARDDYDVEMFEFCLDRGIPMFGVCRGAQFLHVMNGGELFQDVDNHNGDHTMYDVKNRRMVDRVSSVHHQMCIRNPLSDMEIIGTSAKAANRWRNPLDCEKGPSSDVEAFFYRDTCCFGVQGHPEYRGYDGFRKWTMDRMNEYFLENPDLEMQGRVRRIKSDLVAQRKSRWEALRAETQTVVIQ